MKLKALLILFSVFATVWANPSVKTEIRFPKARCVKVDKEGVCLIYSINTPDNVRYNLFVKSGSLLEQKRYTLLVLVSHVGFMDPLQVSLIRSIDYKDLKYGLNLTGTIDSKKIPLKGCSDFRDRILITPFVLKGELTQRQLEDMIRASRYCPDPKNKDACSYSAFFAYVRKTGMVLNAVDREFVTLCKEESTTLR
ncbi:MAG: hypothetical protein ABWK04_08225 [Hydrogenobacter sp.]|uniref:hypothetical protein n=1 Tax=Hydrogenobacter thermophilus TaxID=940 RepID=UPI0030FA2BD3